MIPGGTGTRPKAGGAHVNFFKKSIHLFLLQLVSSTVDGDPLTDGECTRIHLTPHFSPADCAHFMMYTHIMAQECVCAHHTILMVIHVVRLSVCYLTLCSSPCSFPCVSPTPCSSLPNSSCTLYWTSSSMWTTPRQLTTASHRFWTCVSSSDFCL